MLFFAVPFSLAFGATLFSTFYFQKRSSTKIDNIQVSDFYGKIQKATALHLFRVYKISAIVGAPILVALFLIPGFGVQAGTGFFIGMLTVLSVLHVFFLFLVRLDARFVDRSSYGLIQSFNLIFGGGNMLGVFLFGSVLFIVLVYYIVLGSSSIGLISMGAGASFTATLFKAYRVLLSGSNKRSKAKKLPSGSPRLPEVLGNVHVLESVIKMADMLETFFLAIITAILISSLLFPGFAGAIALPLLTTVSGIIFAALSTKLIRIGATTNLSKNVIFSLSGSIVLSSIAALPLIVWAMNENVQYSNAVVWFSMALGFSVLFSIFVFHHKAYLKNLFFTFYPSIMALLFALSLGISYLFAGPYGFFMLIISILSLGGIVVAISVMESSTWNAQLVAYNLDLPRERRNIIKKLGSISKNLSGTINTYNLLTTILVVSALFVIYQKEAEYALVQFNVSLSNPHVVAGIFTGIAATFIFMKFLEHLSVQNSFSEIQPELMGAGKIGFAQKFLLDTSGIDVLKKLVPAIIYIYIVPLVFLWIFGVEVFSGFFYGILAAGVVISIASTIPKNKNDVSFDIKMLNIYSNNTGIIPLSFLKAVGVASLLIIVFIL